MLNCSSPKGAVYSIYLCVLARSSWNNMPGSENFEKKKKNTFSSVFFLLNEECPKLLCVQGIDHRRRKTIPVWNSSGEKGILRGITYVWCLQYWALYDDLVVFKLWARVMYLSFSIWILWKYCLKYRQSKNISRQDEQTTPQLAIKK